MSNDNASGPRASSATQRFVDALLERLPPRLARISAKNFVCEPGVVIKSPTRLTLGQGVVLQRRALLHCGGKVWCDFAGGISLGNHVVVGPSCIFYGAGSIEVGDYSHFGPGAMIMAQAGNVDSQNRLTTEPGHMNDPVVIGKGVWIGAGAVILGDTTLGDNCVIGPNSVVSGNYEANTTLIGNPARAVRRRVVKDTN